MFCQATSKNLNALILTNVLFFASSAFAQFTFDIGGGFSAMNPKIEETRSGATLTHKESVMSPGIMARGHFGYRLGSVVIGGAALFGYESTRFLVTSSNESIFTATNYGITTQQMAYGPSIAFDITPNLQVVGEYYLVAKSTIQYSQEINQNPFKKGDELVGDGIGLGLNFVLTPTIHLIGMIRAYDYKKVTLNGVASDVNSGQFTKAETMGSHLGVQLAL
jgi:hypothetical protein